MGGLDGSAKNGNVQTDKRIGGIAGEALRELSAVSAGYTMHALFAGNTFYLRSVVPLMFVMLQPPQTTEHT